ncbi:MAG: hypothetical protein ACD_3C00108G0002 [uncultured bacterium (gcode 4)]|uniref:Uncharacterized protein n=1 Tax=uncultured bacterium (gcode 4) TaxID=1234023 RepID=K2GCU6_9BACT|nr:MAG: hypothetical protein ACD_3C00108G0002 [uncultured bacterium (gcode 4)]
MEKINDDSHSDSVSSLMTLDDLDTLWDDVWTRIREILENWWSGWESIASVQEKIRAILSEIGLWLSQVYIDRWQFAWKTLDKIFK